MKKIFKILILIAVLIIGFFLVQCSLKIAIPQLKTKVEKEITVSLLLNFGDENIKTFENVKLKEGKTIFDLLKKVTQENNMEFSYKEYPDLGVFIESIDNISNDAKTNKWWQYWVNGQYSQVGASNYKLKNGDIIEWKHIEAQF